MSKLIASGMPAADHGGDASRRPGQEQPGRVGGRLVDVAHAAV